MADINFITSYWSEGGKAECKFYNFVSICRASAVCEILGGGGGGQRQHKVPSVIWSVSETIH